MSVQQQIDRINTAVSAQETLLDQALAAIAGKAAGGGNGGGGERKYATGTFTGSEKTISITGLEFEPAFIFILLPVSTTQGKGGSAFTFALAWDGPSGKTYGVAATANASGSLQVYSQNSTAVFEVSEGMFTVTANYNFKGVTYRWFAIE